MKRALQCVMMAGIGLLMAMPATAKETKIGYVNIEQVSDGYQKTKDYQASLDKRREREEKALESKKAELDKMVSQISLLKEDQQEEERKKAVKIDRELKDKAREVGLDLQKEYGEKTKEIYEDIITAINDYAKTNGFDLIVDKAAVFYGDKTIDITDAILKSVNAKYGAGAKTSSTTGSGTTGSTTKKP